MLKIKELIFMEIYTDGKHKHEIDVRKKINQGKEYFTVTVDGFPYKLTANRLNDGRIEFTFNDKIYRCLVKKDKDERYVFYDGHSFKLKKIDSVNILSDEQGLIADKVSAPMPGVIIQYLVKVGEEVKVNQKVLIIESMKMQNTLVAPFNGIVSKLNYKKGDQVNEGDELLIIQKSTEKE